MNEEIAQSQTAQPDPLAEFADALAFQRHVLAQIEALHRRVDELQASHTTSEAGATEAVNALALLREELTSFLRETAPWFKNVQAQLDRIERNLSSLMTRIDEMLDDILELRARRRDPDSNDWTN